MLNKPRLWKKLALAVIFAVSLFFCIFNTSTRYGRWLYWQDADWGDVDRFAYHTVSTNPGTAKPFAVDTDETIEQVIANFRVDDETLEEFAANHESTALIVVHDDAILLEQYFQGNQRDTLQSSFSCTKSIVSLLVGIAIEDGLIDSVDDSITKYVAGLHPEFKQVTIRHLLTMTSGISDADEQLFGAVPAPWSDKVKVYYDPNCRRLSSTFSLDHSPGERFEYHDFNPILIGMLLENVTGMRLSDYLSEKIWKPVGMQFAARWSVDSRRHGLAKTEAGLHAPAIDFARLGAMLTDPQQTIVSQQWLQHSAQDPGAVPLAKQLFASYADRALQRGDSEMSEHLRSMRYGFYWWGLEREGRCDFYANGHFGQFIYISPAAKLVVVRNGTGHGGLNDWDFGRIFFRLASDVIAAQRDSSAGRESSSKNLTREAYPHRRWDQNESAFQIGLTPQGEIR